MDEELHFAEAMAGVRPLRAAARAESVALRKPSPGTVQRRAAAVVDKQADRNHLTEEYAPPVAPYDIIGFVRPGVQHGVYGKLRRGRYQPEAALDLHRKTVAEARVEVWSFLQQAYADQFRSVLIMHGKSERSQRGAVLKSFVAHWLKQVPEVLAYHSAQPSQGGAGALYVLLKKSEAARERNRQRYRK